MAASLAGSVALTFDDGPDPARTPALLDALADLGVPATFFLLGRAVDMHPQLAARIAREGHELGNHTYSHARPDKISFATLVCELARTDAMIDRIMDKAERPRQR